MKITIEIIAADEEKAIETIATQYGWTTHVYEEEAGKILNPQPPAEYLQAELQKRFLHFIEDREINDVRKDISQNLEVQIKAAQAEALDRVRKDVEISVAVGTK